MKALTTWAHSNGVFMAWAEGGPSALLIGRVVYGAMGIIGVAVLALWGVIVMAWFAVRAESRAVRLLSGASSWRIQAQDGFDLVRAAFPPAMLFLLGVGVAAWVMGGLANAGRMIGLAGAYLAALFLFAAVVGTAVSLLTAPSVAAMARRTPATARFEFGSTLLKGLSLALAIGLLPGLGLQVAEARRQAELQQQVVPASSFVTVKVKAGPDAMSAKSGAFSKLISSLDKAGVVAYADARTDSADPPVEGFDGVFLANELYLKQFNLRVADTSSFEPVADAEAQRLVGGSLAPQLRLNSSGLRGNGLAAYRYVGQAGLFAPNVTGYGFVKMRNPLVLISAKVASTLSDDSIQAALSNGQLMFSDEALLNKRAAECGLESIIFEHNRVTDAAQLSAQTAREQATSLTATLVILVVAVALTAWMAAQVYAARRGDRLFVLRTYGLAWADVLRERLASEVATVVAAVVVASLAYAWRGYPWSPLLLIGALGAGVQPEQHEQRHPLAYLVVTTLAHFAAAEDVFGRVAHRNT